MEPKIGSIHPPEIPSSIPDYSQWLSGQGVGTWFCIDSSSKNNQFMIKRFTPDGELDCDRIFEVEENGAIFDIEKPYQFTYISHCSTCRIIQNEKIFIFNYIENKE